MPSRSEVIEYARTFLGTPFHHQGRRPGVGIDCIGTILVPLWHLGITDINIKRYSRLPNPDLIYGFLRDAEESGLIWTVPKRDGLPADVALFRIRTDPQHFGWITDLGLLHAQFSTDPRESAVVEHRMDQALFDSIVQVYRIRGIE